MCLIVDANMFGDFFKSVEFRDAANWVTNGPGKVVYGGSKYKQELARSERTLRALSELNKQGKVVKLPDTSVDARQATVEARRDLHSDDPHIIAIVIESGCKILCTLDRNLQRDCADRFRARFGVTRPRIYQRAQHATLLCRRNIVAICR